MRILLLSAVNSIHTQRWVTSLIEREIEVLLVTQHNDAAFEDNNSNVVVKLPYSGNIGYFFNSTALRRIVQQYKPDILHAHYVSGYGTTAALTGFKPTIISVWGADIYDFPNASLLHRLLIKYNLSRASNVLSTSNVMAIETSKYTNKHISVTPFGVDLNTFRAEEVQTQFESQDIIIGTIKTLKEKYGIEYLIRAFHKVKTMYPNLSLKLLIVGGGELEEYLKSVTQKLNISDCTIFTGKVSHKDVATYQNMLTISVSVSVLDSESFGVAIVEASACEKPVIVSNVGGLPEVVEDGITGIVVPPRDVDATAAAIEKLVLDKSLRQSMGKAGRERVKRLYDWNNNVTQMIDIYTSIIESKASCR